MALQESAETISSNNVFDIAPYGLVVENAAVLHGAQTPDAAEVILGKRETEILCEGVDRPSERVISRFLNHRKLDDAQPNEVLAAIIDKGHKYSDNTVQILSKILPFFSNYGVLYAKHKSHLYVVREHDQTEEVYVGTFELEDQRGGSIISPNIEAVASPSVYTPNKQRTAEIKALQAGAIHQIGTNAVQLSQKLRPQRATR